MRKYIHMRINAEKEQERHRMAKRVELLVLDSHTSLPFCYGSVAKWQANYARLYGTIDQTDQ